MTTQHHCYSLCGKVCGCTHYDGDDCQFFTPAAAQKPEDAVCWIGCTRHNVHVNGVPVEDPPRSFMVGEPLSAPSRPATVAEKEILRAGEWCCVVLNTNDTCLRPKREHPENGHDFYPGVVDVDWDGERIPAAAEATSAKMPEVFLEHFMGNESWRICDTLKCDVKWHEHRRVVYASAYDRLASECGELREKLKAAERRAEEIPVAALVEFWERCYGYFTTDGMIDVGMDDFQEWCEELGLIKPVVYDPKIHGEVDDAEPGDTIYTRAFGRSK